MRRTRREVIAGASAIGSLGVLGCTGTDGDDDTDDDTDADDDAGADIGDRSLHASRPVELVEPDASIESGFASSNERLTYVHGHGEGNESHWHFAPIEVHEGSDRTVRVRYLDANAELIPVGQAEAYQHAVTLAEASPEEFLSVSVDGDLVTLSAESIGEGELRFDLRRDGDSVWESPLLEVEAIDPDDG